MNSIVGFSLTLIAGASVGISMWPLKWARAWKWENFWFYYAIFSLIVVPFCLAFALLPNLATVYASLSIREIAWPFLMGVLWGFAQLGAGICVHRLGIGVAGAVLNGTGAAFGTIVPLLSLHRDSIQHLSGTLIITGVVMMLAGAAFCGWSGYLREVEARERGDGAGFGEEQAAMRQASYSARAYAMTLGIAVGSGVLSSLLNIALAYSGHIMNLAEQQGAQPSWTPFAVWPIALLGGSLVNIAYAANLLTKNKTWSNFHTGFFRELIYPALSACLWMAGIALYSSGTTYLGILGVSIGFAVFMITMIVGGQFTGLITGEWRLMKPRTYISFGAGVGLLVLAVLTIGLSKYFEA